MITTWSPRAWSSPADIATSMPKLRESCTSTMPSSRAASSSITAAERVGRAVVDEHDLVRHAGQRGADAAVQLREHRLLVQHGDDDRDAHAGRHTIADRDAGREPRAACDQRGLGPHRQLEGAVQRPAGELVVGPPVPRGAAPRERPHQRDRRQQQRVEVREQLGPPARRRQAAAQAGRRVAAQVMVRVVVLRPQPAVRRHGDQQQRAGRRDAAQLGRGDVVALHVLEHVGGQDQVERAVVVRQRLDPRLLDPPSPRRRQNSIAWSDGSTPRAVPSRPNSARLRPVPQPGVEHLRALRQARAAAASPTAPRAGRGTTNARPRGRRAAGRRAPPPSRDRMLSRFVRRPRRRRASTRC